MLVGNSLSTWLCKHSVAIQEELVEEEMIKLIGESEGENLTSDKDEGDKETNITLRLNFPIFGRLFLKILTEFVLATVAKRSLALQTSGLKHYFINIVSKY